MKFLHLLSLRKSAFFWARTGAFVILLVYLTVLVLAYRTTLGPSFLSFQASLQKDDVFRVSWVMPAGLGWDQGIRPGMEVISVDGVPVSDLETGTVYVDPEEKADLRTSAGEILQVRVTQAPIGQSPMKYSLWVTGGIFALLGATVLLRRPDYHAAKMFALASVLVAIACAVAPAAGSPAPPWALVVQFLSMIGIGIAWFPLGFALVEDFSEPHRSIRLLTVSLLLGLFVALAYAVTVLYYPGSYQIVVSSMVLYFSISVLGLVGVLAFRGNRKESPLSHEQARICLWGAALGILPFVFLTLIPEALGHEAFIPNYITVLTLILIPVFFAYAILQYQLMGIRRLVHRGMVYGLSTVVVFIIICLILIATITPIDEVDSGKSLYLLIPIILVSGIILFLPLQRAMRWLINNYFYHDSKDYWSAFGIVPQYLLATDSTQEIATVISERLSQALSLESAQIFLGSNPSQVKLMAKVGEYASDKSGYLQCHVEPYLRDPEFQGLVAIRLESDSLLLAHLVSAGHYLGYMILGPKHGGEVFVEEEKRLLTNLIPMISLVFDKAELSDELRGLNQRLIKAEESARARIAGDLHDGPLQKATLLIATIGNNAEDQKRYATQLVAELREICSRLRPAILSDLGLIPSLEWLLENGAKGNEFFPRLVLYNVSEDERFLPDIEDTLFRIAQEAINNVIKHAQATSVSLSLSKEDGKVILQVIDNGIGFQIASGDKRRFGLPGMRERALQVGGTVDIYSTPGLGTTVSVYIPIKPH